MIKSPDDIAQKLKLSSSEFVYDIYRLRKKNDQPIAIERSFMPIQLIQGMRLDVLADSVYTFMEEELSLTPKSIHRSIRASRPSKLEEKWLQVDWNYPLLEIEQTVFLDNGRPCEYSLTKIKTDEYEFKTVNII